MSSIKIRDLYDKYLSKGCKTETLPSGHELIYPDEELKVRSIGNEFKKVKCLSRHKTYKNLVRISFQKSSPLVTTTDHVCMAYNDDRMLESVAARDLKVGMMVDHYCNKSEHEVIDFITKIEDIGTTEDYVYDLEMDDDSHVFYANDTLVHNSFFMNLEAVTKDRIKKLNLPDNMNDWSDEEKLAMFDHMQHFADDYLVPRVQEIFTKLFWTKNAKVMRYGLEYLTSGGIFEAKKRYIVRKIVDEGPKIANKFKYTGIELKKATVAPEIKEFLKDMYYTAVLDKTFDEVAAKKKMSEIYEKLLTMKPESLAKWQGYGTETQMDGFLVESKGATGIGKCANYYNQIIKKLGLDKKYSLINVKDKIQTIYLKPTNKYGIDQIGFPPRQWPEEFNDIFEVDYPKMMEKVVISPLKSMIKALKMDSLLKWNPAITASLEYSVDDI